ncbi:alpha/beta fold hydrolase [Sphingobium ummariense]
MAKPDYLALEPSKGGRAVSWPGFGTYNYEPISGFGQEIVRLHAEDSGWSQGILYTTGKEKTVVCFMHPRGDFSSHYCIPVLTGAGYAVFGQRSRWNNNDSGCIHEIALVDVAAGVRFLRERGFDNVILVGNSGGGSLYTFYQSQAEQSPPNRLTHTAAGDPYDLNTLDMPKADGVVMLAAHPGEGKYLMSVIDPSVTDENDPLSCDPALDMYNPDNGYRPAPEPSHYSADFIDRYRAAQRARVQRLDAVARQKIADKKAHEELMAAPDFKSRPLAEQIAIGRRAAASKFLTIYRTDANPAFCDLTIEQPSTRKVGSLLGNDPAKTNYHIAGFSSVMTPEAWLSTWSGLASHGSVVDNLKFVSCSFLIVNFTGDCCIFQSEIELMMQSVTAEDKKVVHLEGDHYGVADNGSLQPRDDAAALLVDWLKPRFASA